MKALIVIAALLCCPVPLYAQASTEQVIPRRLRLTFAPTPADPAVVANDAFVNDGQSWLRGTVFLDKNCGVTNGINCTAPALRFGTAVDTDASAGITVVRETIDVDFARDSGTDEAHFRIGGSTGWYFYPTSNTFSWVGRATAPAVSNAGRARLYYDSVLGAVRVSLNGAAYQTLTTANIPATATANTFFAGPTAGGAAAPAMRALVLADIPNALITLPKLNLTTCTTGQVIKVNAGGTAWDCGTDNTSPGGTAWVTTGNAGTGGTGVIGTTDAADFSIQRNGATVTTYDTSGMLVAGRLRSSQTTSHAFETTTSGGGALLGYQKFLARTLPGSGIAFPSATEASLVFNSADSRLYLNEANTGFAAVMTTESHRTMIQWTAKQATQPTTNPASFDVRNDHPVVAFIDSGTTVAIWEGVMLEEYTSVTFEIAFKWMGAGTTGNVVWTCEVERDDSGTDLDADSFGTSVTVTTGTSATSGAPVTTSCSMNTAAIRDNLAAGEAFRIRVSRIGANGSDTMTGDAQILVIQIRRP